MYVFIFIYSICFSFYFVYRVMRRANVELHNTLEKERKERKSAKRFLHPNPNCETNSNLILNPDKTENCQKLRASPT
jgi:hypothetical protein